MLDFSYCGEKMYSSLKQCNITFFKCVNSISGDQWVESDIFSIGDRGKVMVTNKFLEAYPYLEIDDLYQALSYAAWLTEEVEVLLTSA